MNTITPNRAFLVLLATAISAVFLVMIRPFLMALLLAGIFSSLCQPLYRWLVGTCRGHRSAASLLTIVLIVLVVIIPLGGFFGVVTSQALKVTDTVAKQLPSDVQNLDQLESWFTGLPFYDKLQHFVSGLPFHDQLTLDRQTVLTKASQAVQWLSGFLISNLSAATTGTLQFLFMLGLMLYSMYFFLMDGDKLVDLILYYLPLEDEEERRLLDKFRSVTRATLKGTAVIGILQGALAGLALAVAGIPSPVFWGTVMVVLSLIPGIGTGLVWIPAAVILAAGGHWFAGIALAVFCAVVVGSIDNILRPRLVGQDTRMPDLLILLATMGGILMFGILGFIIGPIVAALFVTVWEIYGTAFKDLLPAGRGFPANGPADEDPDEDSGEEPAEEPDDPGD